MTFQTTRPTVAVIGLGNIGSGVALNLAKSGYEVHGVDLDESKVAQLVNLGIQAADSAPAAAATAEVVFTSLPGPKHILAVAQEILPVMAKGSIWVELSTNDLETVQTLVRLCEEAEVGLIDAPVSGGPEGAQAGELSIFVGGRDSDVAKVAPLLDVIGANTKHLGVNGAGVVAKIAQVTLCYTQSIALIEALILGVKGGIEPRTMLDLIQNSAARSYVADNYGPEILNGTYDASFPISHAAKDMRLAVELAKTLSADLPFITDVAELYAEAEATYGSPSPHLLAAQLVERNNNVLLHTHTQDRTQSE